MSVLVPTGGTRVILIPADYGGCGLHRMVNPARANILGDPGRLSVTFGDGVRAKLDRDGNVQSLPPVDADVVVLQRVMDHRIVQCIPMIQAQGVAVVVELDDDIERVDHQNTARQFVDPKTSPRNWLHLKAACQAADLVTVSTPLLARYAAHGRVVVLPNYVPMFLTQIQRRPDPQHVSQVRLGWSGTVETHPRDPAVTRGQIGRVVQETGCQFWQVGQPMGVAQGFGLSKWEKLRCTGWVPLEHYPDALVNLDVGLVPLDGTAFNEAKSALKGLEMAALGIPFVASATADYRRIAKDGIGILAAKPREWYRETRRLVVDHGYRQEQADMMRAAVAATATIEGNAYRWADAWESAVQIRRARSAAKAV